MKLSSLVISILLVMIGAGYSFAEGRFTIALNGTWDFEQTRTAFPPQKFTRKIPVPGLIHLATPKIDQYDLLFPRPDQVNYNQQHNLLQLHYEPRYNWYRRRIKIPTHLKGTQVVLKILKSKYVTQVYVNGMDVGRSIACYTPVEFPVTYALRFGQENEILIRVGDRAWLPSEAAGSTDKEKVNYIPGIWDNVELSFTSQFRVHRALLLPFVPESRVLTRLLIQNFYPAQVFYGDPMSDSCRILIRIYEKENTQALVASVQKTVLIKRDNLTEFEIDVPLTTTHLWTCDDPFLYEAEISLFEGENQSDQTRFSFGMREFRRQGKHFLLNQNRIFLRGTNVTLHRFFEDPDCADLPWNQQWLQRLLNAIPKQLKWNTMRICVGIAPKMWYDLADKSGLMFQNEWLYWQNHGWDEQIRREYTDWVWSDGNHPSIIIWDAINENWDDFIGTILIPELKKVDPTRIWDAGYMTAEQMLLDEMDEPHPYRVGGWRADFDEYYTQNPYSLGDLHDWPPSYRHILESSAAQLVNEYGWMWLWRDGRPSKLMEKNFHFYLGETHTTEQRRMMQAYWLQLQTEWLRTERSLAGVLAFCYLTNNYGYTGDWFIDEIKDLKPGLTLDWFKHCFAPTAVFIDLIDQRYVKHIPPHQPGSRLPFNLVGVNDLAHPVNGKVILKLIDSQGKVSATQLLSLSIPAYYKKYQSVSLLLPEESGGYLLLAEFRADSSDETTSEPVLSRRYLKIGQQEQYIFYDLVPAPLSQDLP